MLIFNQNHKMAYEVHEEKIAYLHKYNIHVHINSIYHPLIDS